MATKQEAQYERRNKNIIELATGQAEHFDSINLAKKRSAAIQGTAGGLGCGILRAKG